MTASASATIDAPIDKVWDAFVNPEKIKKYMFGTTVITDWKKGHKILWQGQWQGKTYEDKGVILEFKPKTKLQYSHFSPLAGQPDRPENYHIVTIVLTDTGAQTTVLLSQSNSGSEQEKAHSEQNWAAMLGSVKKLIEEPDEKNNGTSRT